MMCIMSAEQVISLIKQAREDGFGNAVGAITSPILADLAGCSKRTMQRYLARLREAGQVQYLGQSRIKGGYKLAPSAMR